MEPIFHLSELVPNFFAPKNPVTFGQTQPSDEKGLLNFIGENNCFLNVVIQSLWHLEPFRSKFTSPDILKGHQHKNRESCVYCSLEIIFTQYEFSDDAKIPSTALRKTMALLYKAQSKFQMFELDDAAEAFEAVLACLHNQYSKDPLITTSQLKASAISRSLSFSDPQFIHNGGEQCQDKNCVAHKVFGVNTIEQIHCKKCGASTDPISSTLFTAYAYAAALRSVYQKSPVSSFCQLLSMAGADKRVCPNREKCDNLCPITHTLTSLPEIFSISIVWDTPDASVSEVESFLNMISWQIDLSNIFTLSEKLQRSRNGGKHSTCLYRLRGMICYYGKHYTAYFYSVKHQQWFVFDDTHVRPVGIDWPTIRAKCLKGHLQPSMLFYECDEPQTKVTESMEQHPSIWTSELIARSFVTEMSSPTPGQNALEKNKIASASDKSDRLSDSSLLQINRIIRQLEEREKAERNESPVDVKVSSGKLGDISGNAPISGIELLSNGPEDNQVQISSNEPTQEGEPKEYRKDDLHVVRISKIGSDQLEKVIEETLRNSLESPQAQEEREKEKMEVFEEILKLSRREKMENDAEELAQKIDNYNLVVAQPSMESEPFVMLPSESQFERERDFIVTRTNWLYRRQERVFRFALDRFYRMTPDLQATKDTFDYKDVFDVNITDSNNMIIRFYSGKEAQYLQSNKIEEILDILIRRSKSLNHHIIVKKL